MGKDIFDSFIQFEDDFKTSAGDENTNEMREYVSFEVPHSMIIFF